MKVFITDGGYKHTLGATRSLGKKGIHVTVGSADRNSQSFFSKYCRDHFLRFRVPTTWKLLQEAGFKYDITFGYADCVGFRNGMCHPFRPFNLNTNDYIDIMEIPLIIKDRTFDTYMNLDLINTWEITKDLIDTVGRCGGVITILWHGDMFMIDGMGEMYERILQYC